MFRINYSSGRLVTTNEFQAPQPHAIWGRARTSHMGINAADSARSQFPTMQMDEMKKELGDIATSEEPSRAQVANGEKEEESMMPNMAKATCKEDGKKSKKGNRHEMRSKVTLKYNTERVDSSDDEKPSEEEEIKKPNIDDKLEIKKPDIEDKLEIKKVTTPEGRIRMRKGFKVTIKTLPKYVVDFPKNKKPAEEKDPVPKEGSGNQNGNDPNSSGSEEVDEESIEIRTDFNMYESDDPSDRRMMRKKLDLIAETVPAALARVPVPPLSAIRNPLLPGYESPPDQKVFYAVSKMENVVSSSSDTD